MIHTSKDEACLLLYLFIYVRATTGLFISLEIGVKEKCEPWVLLDLNSIKKKNDELERAFLFIQSMMAFEVMSTRCAMHMYQI